MSFLMLVPSYELGWCAERSARAQERMTKWPVNGPARCDGLGEQQRQPRWAPAGRVVVHLDVPEDPAPPTVDRAEEHRPRLATAAGLVLELELGQHDTVAGDV